MNLLRALLTKAQHYMRRFLTVGGILLTSSLILWRLGHQRFRPKLTESPPVENSPPSEAYDATTAAIPVASNPSPPPRSAVARRRFSLAMLKMPRRKVTWAVALTLAALLAVALLYVRGYWQPTYYVAYVKRDQSRPFDELHEVALRKYIDELNDELKKESHNARFEMKVFSTKDQEGNNHSVEKYKEILKDEKVLVVVDNSWAKELKHVAEMIRTEGIPVISLNADKHDRDYGKNAIFIGYEDTVPGKAVNFSKNILENQKVIFVTETEYELSAKFMNEFRQTGTEKITLSVKSHDATNKAEAKNLFYNLDIELARWDRLQSRPVVILNTHSNWGSKVMRHIDTQHTGVDIIAGPYAIEWRDPYKFGFRENGNRLLLFTYPSDAVSKKVYDDEKNIRLNHPGVLKERAQLFVKRCLDAVSIIRGIVLDKDTNKSPLLRAAFTKFFREKFAERKHLRVQDELYIFDGHLLLSDERTFEEHFNGKISSYPQQLDSQNQETFNISFGMELINVSNVDMETRSFNAVFLYWVKFDEKHPDAAEHIHFRNQKSGTPIQLDPGEKSLGAKGYRLYKMSGDFVLDVDIWKYPFDTQELNIAVDLITPPGEAGISFDYDSFNRSKKVKEFNLDDWQVEEFYATVDTTVANPLSGGYGLTDSTPRKFKTLNVRILISRHRLSPTLTIIAPLLMIGFAAVALLYVRDSSFANIGQACVGIFLGIVSYAVAFTQVSPRSGVMTIADMLFYYTFITVLVIFVKVIFFNADILADGATPIAGRRTFRLGRFRAMVSYLLFAVGILIYGLYFR